MILDFLVNVIVLCFSLSFFVVAYMLLCRDYRHFTGISKKEDAKYWDAFFNRFYFVMITFATIGYGDISPKSKTARILTISIILFIMIVLLKSADSAIKYYKSVLDISGNRPENWFK